MERIVATFCVSLNSDRWTRPALRPETCAPPSKRSAPVSRANPCHAATRCGWLRALAAVLKDHQGAICGAIDADFGHRSEAETRLLEFYPSLEAIEYARRHVARWMAIEPRRTSLLFQPGRSELRYQPLGVVGILAPWNYPLYGQTERVLAAVRRFVRTPGA